MKILLMRYKQAWLDYCCINLTSQEDKFYTNNQFGEIIIKLNKEKLNPSTNAKSDVFLCKTIVLNIISLKKSKKVLAQAIRAI